MTEAEWLACNNPARMAEHVRERASSRKLRLCAVNWARLAAGRIAPRKGPGFQWLVHQGPTWSVWLDAAEQCLDGLLSPKALRAVRQGTGGPYNLFLHACRVTGFSISDVYTSLARTQIEFGVPSDREVCAVTRDVVNPFHDVALSPSWLVANDGAALRLARDIYDERKWELMPILADALEDAGCADGAILGHLRAPAPHVRGCWAVDAVLGKG
jgi:hypothetical protein